MSSEGNIDISTETVSMEQSSTSGAKRKRGRPRRYEYPSYELPQRTQLNQNSVNLVKTFDNQGNLGKDDILGKHFVGKMTNKFPGFCLITVKVKETQVLKGWVPNQNNLHPITPKNDLMPELPILQPSQVQKQASAIPMQAVPPVPIHLEDVTLAKPLQTRRPVDKTTVKHAIPLATRPYMGSGVVAAVPVSVSPGNVEMGTLAKQDTECMISQPPVAAVPITSVPPVFVSGKQVANQNELVGEKSCSDFQKDSELSDGTKDSSVKAEKPNAALVDVVVKDSPGERQLLNVQGTGEVGESSGQNQHLNTTVNDDIKIALGTRYQPNSANCDHQISKEPSDITEKSDLLKTQNVVLKGVDDPKSVAADDVHGMMNTK